MRNVILQMSVSLDGFVALPDGTHRWGTGPEDDALREWKTETLRSAGAHLMGRVTYEHMAAAWPSSTSAYGSAMNAIPKVVFSQTLDRADWPESRIARGDLVEEIAGIKAEPGNDVLAHGGAAFARSLCRHGLVDEYRLLIQPVALGAGLPIFTELGGPAFLELAEARAFGTGSVLHVYRPRP